MLKQTISYGSSSRHRTASDPASPSTTVPSSPRAPFSIATGAAVDVRAWWAACEGDPAATFFGTPDWCQILVEAFPAFRPQPHLFTFGDGRRVVVPAIEVKRALGRLSALHSMPFGTYGGPIGLPSEDPAEVSAILEHVHVGGWPRFQTTMFPNPLGPDRLGQVSNGEDFVYAPDLTGGFEAWWQGLAPRTRYHVRKAETRGIVVESVMDAEDFEAFYRLYRASSRAWSSAPHYGRHFFRAVWNANSPRIQLWTARLGPRVVAGVLVFRFGRHVTPFLSAVAPDARVLAPTNLIYTRLIADAAATRGRQISFLGSGGRPGVERFKRSMGGVRHDFRFVNLTGPAYALVRNRVVASVRRSVGRSVRRSVRGIGARLTRRDADAADVANTDGALV